MILSCEGGGERSFNTSNFVYHLLPPQQQLHQREDHILQIDIHQAPLTTLL